MTLEDHLTAFDACREARKWARDYPTLRAAWDACERADWLLWYAAKRGTDRKLLVCAACACARTALPHVPSGENRPRRAIELAARWANGDSAVTVTELHAAYAAASAASAASAADAADAAYAAFAAAYAAYTAYMASAANAAAYAAAYAASAASAASAADAAFAAEAADAARRRAHRTMCAIVRDLIPCPEEP